MENKKICYIDLDGVLFDFIKKLYELFPHIQYLTGKEEEEQIDICCESEKGQRIFLDLELMPDAIWAYKNLNKNYIVYILSTAMWHVPYSFMDKRISIEKHFKDEIYKKLNLSHNKGLFRGDYLIDDRIKNGVETFQGEHIHFGKGITKNWIETIKYLSEKDNWKIEYYA